MKKANNLNFIYNFVTLIKTFVNKNFLFILFNNFFYIFSDFLSITCKIFDLTTIFIQGFVWKAIANADTERSSCTRI